MTVNDKLIHAELVRTKRRAQLDANTHLQTLLLIGVVTLCCLASFELFGASGARTLAGKVATEGKPIHGQAAISVGGTQHAAIFSNLRNVADFAALGRQHTARATLYGALARESAGAVGQLEAEAFSKVPSQGAKGFQNSADGANAFLFPTQFDRSRSRTWKDRWGQINRSLRQGRFDSREIVEILNAANPNAEPLVHAYTNILEDIVEDIGLYDGKGPWKLSGLEEGVEPSLSSNGAELSAVHALTIAAGSLEGRQFDLQQYPFRKTTRTAQTVFEGRLRASQRVLSRATIKKIETLQRMVMDGIRISEAKRDDVFGAPFLGPPKAIE